MFKNAEHQRNQTSIDTTVERKRTTLFELVQKFINLQKLLVFALSIINSEIFLNQKLQIAK